MATPKLEIHYEEEWAGLYVDGKLDRVGDAYLAEQRAFELLGVTLVHDDAFMRGHKDEDAVARTLDDVAAYRDRRDADRVTAARLRREAEQLVAEAAALELRNGHSDGWPPPTIVHLLYREGVRSTRCCSQEVAQLPAAHRTTTDPAAATCPAWKGTG